MPAIQRTQCESCKKDMIREVGLITVEPALCPRCTEIDRPNRYPPWEMHPCFEDYEED